MAEKKITINLQMKDDGSVKLVASNLEKTLGKAVTTLQSQLATLGTTLKDFNRTMLGGTDKATSLATSLKNINITSFRSIKANADMLSDALRRAREVVNSMIGGFKNMEAGMVSSEKNMTRTVATESAKRMSIRQKEAVPVGAYSPIGNQPDLFRRVTPYTTGGEQLPLAFDATTKSAKAMSQTMDVLGRTIPQQTSKWGAFKNMVADAGRKMWDMTGISDKVSSALDRHGASAGFVAMKVVRLMIAYMALRKVLEAVNFIIDRFFGSVEEYKMNVASTAAVVTQFMQMEPGESLADGYKRAVAYAKDLVPVLEKMSATTLLSGQQLNLLNTELAKAGIFLDTNNQKAIAGFQALANTIAILTKGQDVERQLMTEARALFAGEARAGAMLIKMLQSIDPQLKEHLKIWKEEDTVLEHMNILLRGFAAAGKDLAGTWMAIKTLLLTTVNQVLRDTARPIVEEILGYVKDLNTWLEKNKKVIQDEITQGWIKLKALVLGVAEGLADVSKHIDHMVAQGTDVNGWIDTVGKGFSFIGEVLLPGITEALDHMVSSFAAFVKEVIHGIKAMWAAHQGNFKLAMEEMDKMIEEGNKSWKEAFPGGAGTMEERYMKWDLRWAGADPAELMKQTDEYVEKYQNLTFDWAIKWGDPELELAKTAIKAKNLSMEIVRGTASTTSNLNTELTAKTEQQWRLGTGKFKQPLELAQEVTIPKELSKPKAALGVGEEDAKLRKKRQDEERAYWDAKWALDKQNFTQEFELIKAHNDHILAVEEARYDLGLTSFTQYNEEKRKNWESNAAAELIEIGKQKKLLQDTAKERIKAIEGDETITEAGKEEQRRNVLYQFQIELAKELNRENAIGNAIQLDALKEINDLMKQKYDLLVGQIELSITLRNMEVEHATTMIEKYQAYNQKVREYQLERGKISAPEYYKQERASVMTEDTTRRLEAQAKYSTVVIENARKETAAINLNAKERALIIEENDRKELIARTTLSNEIIQLEQDTQSKLLDIHLESSNNIQNIYEEGGGWLGVAKKSLENLYLKYRETWNDIDDIIKTSVDGVTGTFKQVFSDILNNEVKPFKEYITSLFNDIANAFVNMAINKMIADLMKGLGISTQEAGPKQILIALLQQEALLKERVAQANLQEIGQIPILITETRLLITQIEAQTAAYWALYIAKSAAGALGGGGGGATGSGDMNFGAGTQPWSPMQHGGSVSAGKRYLIGEAGPELFVPKSSGTIVPNSSSSNPNIDVVINVENNTGQPIRARESVLKFDESVKRWVKQIVLESAATDPNFRGAMNVRR